MNYLIGLFESVRDFIATGGDVLYFVAAALFLMWVLMIERYWYLTSVFPKVKKNIIANWDARADTTSWYAHRIRDTWISQASDADYQNHYCNVSTNRSTWNSNRYDQCFRDNGNTGHQQRSSNGSWYLYGNDPDNGGNGSRAIWTVHQFTS